MMPLRWPTIFRVIVIIALGAHVYFMYGTARIMRHDFGFHPQTFVVSALFALAMLIPLWWAAWLPDVPEAFQQWRGSRRWSRRRCPVCNYSFAGLADVHCPECGAELREPSRHELSLRTLRRFLVICLVAWTCGVGAGEAGITLDEASFRRLALEGEVGDDQTLVMRRAWPHGDSVMSYSPSAGFTAADAE